MHVLHNALYTDEVYVLHTAYYEHTLVYIILSMYCVHSDYMFYTTISMHYMFDTLQCILYDLLSAVVIVAVYSAHPL
jgi:hypothetical protein